MGLRLLPRYGYDERKEFEGLVLDCSLNINEAVRWIVEHYAPQEIYPEIELAEWAEMNGYTKASPLV